MNAKEEAEIRKLDAEARYYTTRTEGMALDLDRASSVAGESDNIVFYDDVSDTNVWNMIHVLDQWGRRFPNRPLRLILNSPGGSVIDGLHLYDFLMDFRKDHFLTTVGMGMAASMGGVILQAGEIRLMSKNAFLLIHEVAADTGGKLSMMEDSTALFKSLQGKCVAILAEKSTMTDKQIITKINRRDWWLIAQDALGLGFIDGIL